MHLRDLRGRRSQAVALLLAVLCLGAAQVVSTRWPVAVPTLVVAAVCLAASGGGLLGLLVAVFGAGLAPLDTPLRVALAVGALIVFDRTSRIRETAEELREHAIVDRLTGLCTYEYFAESLAGEIGRVRRYGGRCSLIVLDLDRFKEVNDRFGHQVGNELLTRVGQTILALKRDSDVAARFGGEELVVVVPGSSGEAERLAERIRGHVERIEVEHRGRPVRVTLSAGVAEFPRDGGSAESLFDAADEALYRAKHGGRNQVVLAHAAPVRTPAAGLARTAVG